MAWSGEEINCLIAERRRTNQVNKYINLFIFLIMNFLTNNK